MYLKLVCVLNIIAVIIFIICTVLRSNNLPHIIFGIVTIIGELLAVVFVLKGKIDAVIVANIKNRIKCKT